jgi:glucosamine--fructose-6-phosphate aminotransferase (isomerizing)
VSYGAPGADIEDGRVWIQTRCPEAAGSKPSRVDFPVARTVAAMICDHDPSHRDAQEVESTGSELMPGDDKSEGRTDAPRFRHAMLQEIYQQPQAIRNTIERNVEDGVIFPTTLDAIESALAAFKKIIIAASGSSRHAGLVGEVMIEDLADVAVDVEYASEYGCRSTHTGTDAIVVVITQSGETADTIAAQREALNRGATTIAISNVADSTIAREAGARLITCAAPERAIPATKSFTAQLTILYLFALFLACRRRHVTPETARSLLDCLAEIPGEIEKYLPAWDAQAEEKARLFRHAKTFLFIGRGAHYALAREGALKLKEVSYVQAEGLPAGELLHGPNALIDEKLLVVVIATRDSANPYSMLRYQKTLSVLDYVKGHGGKTIVIATEGDRDVLALSDQVVYVPPAIELLLPLLEVIPLQLFAYHFAVLNGCNVDHPRNLVKSVVNE